MLQSKFSPSSGALDLGLNAEYWGPLFWEVFYLAAVGYAVDPSPQEKEGFRLFFESMRVVLPCARCRLSYHEHLLENPLGEEALSGRDALFRWVHRLHTAVTGTLKKKELASLETLQKSFYPPSVYPLPVAEATRVLPIVTRQVMTPRLMPLAEQLRNDPQSTPKTTLARPASFTTVPSPNSVQLAGQQQRQAARVAQVEARRQLQILQSQQIEQARQLARARSAPVVRSRPVQISGRVGYLRPQYLSTSVPQFDVPAISPPYTPRGAVATVGALMRPLAAAAPAAPKRYSKCGCSRRRLG